MRLDVALTPALVPASGASSRSVYVVIDVVRATTTLSVLFERGARRVLIAPSISVAREARAVLGAEFLLAGEEGGLPPAGFDLGNSPAQIERAQVAERDVIFATTNGTVALLACAGGEMVLAGSLRNAEAVMAQAYAGVAGRGASEATFVAAATGTSEGWLAWHTPDITLVCSGRDGRPAFDDTLCAGGLVDAALGLARADGVQCQLGEGARIAQAAWQQVTTTCTIEGALAASDAGQAVLRVGLGSDLGWCAARDVSDVTPRITGRTLHDRVLVIET